MFPCQTRRALPPFALALVALASGTEAQSKERGTPPIQSFEPTAYEGTIQVFDASQGPDGRMHLVVPRDFSILHHDGEHWEHDVLSVPPLSIDVDPEGRIWIGSSRDVGYVDEESGFVPVGGGTLEEETAVLAFHDTLWTAKGTFFLAEDLLLRWDGERTTSWSPPGESLFVDLTARGDEVFVLDSLRGLLRVDGDDLVESSALGPNPIPPGVLYADTEHLWIAWLEEDGDLHVRSDHGVERVTDHTRAPYLFTNPTYLTDLLVTPDGDVAVATLRGLLLLDADGDVLAWLDDEHGLESSFVYSLEADEDGGIWACQASGLARIDMTAPVSSFGATEGLTDTPLDVVRHRGELFCATHEGLFRLSLEATRARFVPVEALPPQPVYSLVSTPYGLLAASEIGLFLYESGAAMLLDDTPQLSLATASPEGDQVLLAGYDELRMAKWNPELSDWEVTASIPASWSSDAIVADTAGFWIYSLDRELRRVPFDGEEFGPVVLVPGSWRGIAAIETRLLHWDRESIYEISPDRLTPVRSRALAALPWEDIQRRFLNVELVVAPDDRVWLLEGRCIQRLSGDLRQGIEHTPDFAWHSPRGSEGCTFDSVDGSVAWIGTHRGLLRLETTATVPSRRARPRIDARDSREQAAIVDGTVLSSRSDVRFSFASAAFGLAPIEYSYRLRGLQHEWSPWTRSTETEYVRLPGGRYVFEVRARSRGTSLGETQRAFVVQTPWFARLPVVVGYILVLTAVVVSISRWRSFRFERENRRLEERVAEQTHELRVSKESVFRRTVELEAANSRLHRAIEARNDADRAKSELNERLEASERFQSLGAVAGGIAHDFNNYLTSMRGYAELALLDPSMKDEAAEYVHNITTISVQAAELCSNLLSLAGRRPLEKTSLDLSQVVRGMEKLLHTSMVDRGELRFDLADRLPSVEADLASVQRSVVNLVVNAAEAVQPPHGWVTIRSGVKNCTESELQRMHSDGDPAPGTYVFIEVSDNGHGLSPDDERRVFDPYFTTKFVGRGLGLATVFGIVSSHGGAVDVLSTMGRGASFRLLFPRSRSDVDEAQPDSTPPAGDGDPLEGRILIVDDDAIVRGMTVRLCALLGLESTPADGGAEALRLVRDPAMRFDVVLLDLSMPGMDGQTVLDRIRLRDPDLPVVLMSGYTDQLRVDQLDPATTFLAKPYSREDLRVVLRKALASRD